jgi:hypothetical protein
MSVKHSRVSLSADELPPCGERMRSARLTVLY